MAVSHESPPLLSSIPLATLSILYSLVNRFVLFWFGESLGLEETVYHSISFLELPDHKHLMVLIIWYYRLSFYQFKCIFMSCQTYTFQTYKFRIKSMNKIDSQKKIFLSVGGWGSLIISSILIPSSILLLLHSRLIISSWQIQGKYLFTYCCCYTPIFAALFPLFFFTGKKNNEHITY
jgi:hypothetical protein